MALSLQEIFINNLKFYRKANKMSQESLSEKLDKGVNYINKIEAHLSFPTVQVIEQIADILGIRPWQLFADETCPKNIVATDKEKFISELTETLYKKLSADMCQILEKI